MIYLKNDEANAIAQAECALAKLGLCEQMELASGVQCKKLQMEKKTKRHKNKLYYYNAFKRWLLNKFTLPNTIMPNLIFKRLLTGYDRSSGGRKIGEKPNKNVKTCNLSRARITPGKKGKPLQSSNEEIRFSNVSPDSS